MTKPVFDIYNGKFLKHKHSAKDTFTIIKVTHSELITLINTSELITGALYQITDYVTTTAQADTVSAGHQFDLIVLAISPNTISEDAKATPHENDTYFSGRANLAAWEIKYTPFNDFSIYSWADETSGKGVIYYMKDEYNNECPYDFKNIQFARTAGGVVPQTDNYYTFSWVNENDIVEDLSLIGNNLVNDEDKLNGVFNNKIGICSSYRFTASVSLYDLSNNVFISTYSYDNGYFNGCYSNTFGDNCHSNTFGNDCESNNFGNYCESNNFGNYCHSNTFGNNCFLNTFGNYCFSNNFGNDCFLNTFVSNYYYNTFGNYCYSNTFGDNCYYNTFGDSCYSNTFGDNFKYLFLIKTSKNLSSVTELINKNYPHEIIGTDGGKALIKWYNSSGNLQTQLVS